MSHLIDLTGNVYGRLTVIEKGPSSDGKMTRWVCRCECGNERLVIGSNLKTGRQVSCGCLDLERKTKHGANTRGFTKPEWRAWQNIKKRCYYDKDVQYEGYGMRGITVCDRWLNSFENFYADMGDRPSPKHSIDRIDTSGNYEPDNCKWSTASEQIINQRMRKDNSSGCKGVSKDKKSGKWYAYISPGENEKRIGLGYFTELEDAIEARKQAETKYRTLAN